MQFIPFGNSPFFMNKIINARPKSRKTTNISMWSNTFMPNITICLRSIAINITSSTINWVLRRAIVRFAIWCWWFSAYIARITYLFDRCCWIINRLSFCSHRTPPYIYIIWAIAILLRHCLILNKSIVIASLHHDKFFVFYIGTLLESKYFYAYL